LQVYSFERNFVSSDSSGFKLFYFGFHLHDQKELKFPKKELKYC